MKKSVGRWAPFNFAAGPCISSQAVILTKFRFTSCVPVDNISDLGTRVSTEKKRCVSPQSSDA